MFSPPEFESKELALPHIAAWLDAKLREAGMDGGDFAAARKELVKGLVKGQMLPCFACGDRSKVYHRHMRHPHGHCAALMLREMRLRKIEAKTKGKKFNPWFHIESEIILAASPGGKRTNQDVRELRHWGLMKEKPVLPPPSKKSHGYYRLTKAGVKYANRKKKVRRKMVIWRGDVICFYGPYVGVLDTIGDHFDYAELMGT